MGFDNPLHIAFVLFIVLVVFGAKRLPELGRSLGSGMRGFRDALTGVDAHASLPAPAPAAVHVTSAPVAEEPAAAPHTAVPAAPAALTIDTSARAQL
jgi:sec-independent protein translocase protein TatA